MQSNHQGLRCSVLHQVLSHERESGLYELVLNKYPKAQSYASPDHWPKAILNSCLVEIFNTPLLNCSYCVFIDGLDETAEDENFADLLSLFRNLSQLPRIKICVSSRKEPEFRSALADYPHLTLHDLTKGSMTQYVVQSLPSELLNEKILNEHSDTLLQVLVEKAHGVFLWLHLVIRSLKRGIRDGNTTQQMVERVSQLPSKLTELYAHMWCRLGDDQNLYQKTAAEYINLMISAMSLRVSKRRSRSIRMSGFVLILAKYPEMGEKCLLAKSPAQMAVLNSWCSSKLREIEGCCAGLLEFLGDRPVMRAPTACLQGLRDSASRAAFFHRTAVDFFEEAKEGQEILKSDPSTYTERLLRLARALAVTMAFWGPTTLAYEYYVDAAYASLSSAIKEEQHLCTKEEVVPIFTLLEDTFILLGLGQTSRLRTVIRFPPLCKFWIDQNFFDSNTKLKAFCSYWISYPGIISWRGSDFVKYMVDNGANPNTKVIVSFKTTFFTSPWQRWLANSFSDVLRISIRYSRNLPEILTQMELFLRENVDMNERTSVVFCHTKGAGLVCHPDANLVRHGFADGVKHDGTNSLWIINASAFWFCTKLLRLCRDSVRLDEAAEFQARVVQRLLLNKQPCNISASFHNPKITTIIWHEDKTSPSFVGYPSGKHQTSLFNRIIRHLPGAKCLKTDNNGDIDASIFRSTLTGSDEKSTDNEVSEDGLVISDALLYDSEDWWDAFSRLYDSVLECLHDYIEDYGNERELIDQLGLTRVLNQHIGGIPVDELEKYQPAEEPDYWDEWDEVFHFDRRSEIQLDQLSSQGQILFAAHEARANLHKRAGQENTAVSKTL